jgi:hypothetical protein
VSGVSTLRIKSNVRPFFSGLDIVWRLNPISFTWKEGRRAKGVSLAQLNIIAGSSPPHYTRNEQAQEMQILGELNPSDDLTCVAIAHCSLPLRVIIFWADIGQCC